MNSLRMSRRIFAVAVSIGVAWTSLDAPSAQGQDDKAVAAAVNAGIETEQQFQTVFEYVRSSNEEEKWRQIPWVPSLWSGVELANEQHKPIFVWAMNGDPLGCV